MPLGPHNDNPNYIIQVGNSEVEMWTKAGKIKINLQKGADIRALDKILATYILN